MHVDAWRGWIKKADEKLLWALIANSVARDLQQFRIHLRNKSTLQAAGAALRTRLYDAETQDRQCGSGLRWPRQTKCSAIRSLAVACPGSHAAHLFLCKHWLRAPRRPPAQRSVRFLATAWVEAGRRHTLRGRRGAERKRRLAVTRLKRRFPEAGTPNRDSGSIRRRKLRACSATLIFLVPEPMRAFGGAAPGAQEKNCRVAAVR